jgi:uncharacterized C2H2 Zn-finger protein
LLCFQLTTFLTSSNGELRYPCPDCVQAFPAASARNTHRKKAHGYQPHHTARFLAKQEAKAQQALKKAQQALKDAKQKSGKARAKNTRDQLPHNNTENTSSPGATLSDILTNDTYHEDLWKQVVDVPRRHASGPKDSQDVQIRVSVSVAAAPAFDAPKTLQADSDVSSPEVGQLQPSQTRSTYQGMGF